MLQPYNRPPISVSDQVKHLAAKGLDVERPELAESHLTEKGYYRLKAYLLPFRKHNGLFLEGAKLSQAVDLHDFDEKLRLLVFKHIQRTEVVIRNRLNEHMCSRTGNAFWYLDSSLFGWNTTAYADTVNKLRASFLDSQETFAKHFRERYRNEYCRFYSLMPPSWMAMELMTFGNLLTLLNSISSETIETHKLDRWSRKEIGPDKFKKLTNWLHCIRDVRNHCAHHNRLFNRNFPAPDGIKRQLCREVDLVKIPESQKPQDQLNRLYTVLAAMLTISKTVGLESIGPELGELFNAFPEAKRHLTSMGFPEDWQREPLYFPPPSKG